MHILICNDDGYSAQGIKALTSVMERFGRVTVVAPEYNHSGASNSLTLNQPLTVTEIDERTFAVSGTPSDCIHVAMTGLLSEKPDLIVSGINGGANMGDDTLYSGTVAAAMEGYIFGVDSIAFSQIERGWKELPAAAEAASTVVERFLKNKNSEKTVLLNVNIPCLPSSDLKGIAATRLGRRFSADPLVKTVNPRGMTVYWLGKAGRPADAAEGTDFWAVAHGFVSVTPLAIDLTSHEEVASAAQWMA